MSPSEWIGSTGVFILLLAYLLLLLKVLSQRDKLYLAMNAVGAGLSTLASYMIDYIPFVILEGAWMMVSLAALFRKEGNKPSLQP